MSADLRKRAPRLPEAIDLAGVRLRLIRATHKSPFEGREPPDRHERSVWNDGHGHPYAALILVDETEMLRGHLCWFPWQDCAAGGIYAFWLEPGLRGQGLGSLLLDTALCDMARVSELGGPFRRAEVQTHLVRHSDAVALYESRGFHIDDAWVTQ